MANVLTASLPQLSSERTVNVSSASISNTILDGNAAATVAGDDNSDNADSTLPAVVLAVFVMAGFVALVCLYLACSSARSKQRRKHIAIINSSSLISGDNDNKHMTAKWEFRASQVSKFLSQRREVAANVEGQPLLIATATSPIERQSGDSHNDAVAVDMPPSMVDGFESFDESHVSDRTDGGGVSTNRTWSMTRKLRAFDVRRRVPFIDVCPFGTIEIRTAAGARTTPTESFKAARRRPPWRQWEVSGPSEFVAEALTIPSSQAKRGCLVQRRLSDVSGVRHKPGLRQDCRQPRRAGSASDVCAGVRRVPILTASTTTSPPLPQPLPLTPSSWPCDTKLPTLLTGLVSVDHLTDHIAAMHADADLGFEREMEEVHAVGGRPAAASRMTANRAKNRYLNVVAYDHSRVRLGVDAGMPQTSDYINANYITGWPRRVSDLLHDGKDTASRDDVRFIATQGPMAGSPLTTVAPTIFDFWRLVWEQRVRVVLMITNLVENGKRKCDQYWPDVPGVWCDVPRHMSGGPGMRLALRLESCVVDGDHIVRTMTLSKGLSTSATSLQQQKQRKIKHLQFIGWPDHGVPAHASSVLRFRRAANAANGESQDRSEAVPLMLIHCSAGVGRTGTYVSIDTAIRQAECRAAVNVFGYVRHIRSERNFMVQTEEQYAFVHHALAMQLHRQQQPATATPSTDPDDRSAAADTL